ncbi:hypothetical protein HELRODRAFT_103893 [Helobdella robusta]|uniref:Citrate transporter-like domain-containing protein n=1 Tax=Helobdella robusta TaxID=6412 RepID=T1EDI2_HELRO|nr:hypothetical protein HELRODRAFT_103893 [Helobdella robusta]ESN92180.1 hypothetical protein HELRODRAFT_103893 [Helobdella robusta]
MIVYWMTEVIPMAVTALIPIVLFPWLGVMDSKDICINYLKDANMLFFGGLLVAVAVEKWNLHKRVALRVLMLVGSKPKWIIFGFMVVTAFLSMWLNNTATTAMMMPIAQAVLTELDDNRKKQLEIKRTESRVKMAATLASMTPEEVDSQKKFSLFRTALKLSIPFASSIGGTGTLIGCGPNIILKGQMEILYSTSMINFTSWLVIGMPAMVLDLFFAWVIILFIFFGFRETFGRNKVESDDTANQVIKTEYIKLGKMTFAEMVVGASFLVLAFLWVSREPEFVKGWVKYVWLVGWLFVTDACVAITICVLLFILPSKFPNYLCFRRRRDADPPKPAPPILDWPTANKQMPWSVILLLGGGFALADACKVSKLSESIGQFLISLKNLPQVVVSMIMVVCAFVMTQFTSNMATTTIMIPILAQISSETCINPLYLMLPVTIASSFAFILPVGTPPNAIAYSYGDITIVQMVSRC